MNINRIKPLKMRTPSLLLIVYVISPFFLISQTSVDPTYILLGRDNFPASNEVVTDTFFFVDMAKGAIRGGELFESRHWSAVVGKNSLAWGLNNRASGRNSISMGDSTVATTTAAFAAGYRTIAEGNIAPTAMGWETRASGQRAPTAMGWQTIASGQNAATALGWQTTASGQNGATALGYETTASGQSGATAVGRLTTASSSGAFASGQSTLASGQASSAMGFSSAATGSFGTFAVGFNARATGDFGATAMGNYTIANGDDCLVVGRFNDTLVSRGFNIIETSPLFIIGNGDHDTMRSNALVVRKDGYVGIGVDTPTAMLTVLGSELNNTPDLAITSEDALVQLGMNQRGPHGFSFGDDTVDEGIKLVYRTASNRLQIEEGTAFSSNIPLFVFEDSGMMGIGDGAPNDALDVVGDIDATGCIQTDDAGSIGGTCLSDKRLKKRILPLDNQLHLINKLRPVLFEWKDATINGGQNADMGLIAQEVADVIPEMITKDDEGFMRIKYDVKLQIRLIKAIQEQQHLIQELMDKNAALEKRIDKMEISE